MELNGIQLSMTEVHLHDRGGPLLTTQHVYTVLTSFLHIMKVNETGKNIFPNI